MQWDVSLERLPASVSTSESFQVTLEDVLLAYKLEVMAEHTP
jgi:hypothetical protein